MVLNNRFLQFVQLVDFSGSITYNSSGFAVLPPYTVNYIPGSMQPIKQSQLKFLPEGTHYADYLQVLTNYPIFVDIFDTQLGSYFIYNNNTVYKIISDQNFRPFLKLSSNHWETLIVKDNRLTFNGTVLNLPLPEINGEYAPLFDLVTMVNQCFTSPSLTTLWAFQQELQPPFPYCTITIESIENIDNTNYVTIDSSTQTLYTNISNNLLVKFSFYALDQIQALNLMQQFKLNYVNFEFTDPLFQWAGFVEGSNDVVEQLYEDRTIFNATVYMRFSFIVQQTSSSSQTINTVAFTLSIPPVS